MISYTFKSILFAANGPKAPVNRGKFAANQNKSNRIEKFQQHTFQKSDSPNVSAVLKKVFQDTYRDLANDVGFFLLQ